MKVLTNTGSRRLGIPGRRAIILAPGESVEINAAQLKDIKRNRTTARWLEAGRLRVGDKGEAVRLKAVTPKTVTPKARPNRRVKKDDREKQVLPEGVTGEGVEIHHKDGGWYEVFVDGFKVTDRNIRKSEATEIAAEYK